MFADLRVQNLSIVPAKYTLLWNQYELLDWNNEMHRQYDADYDKN